MAEATALQSIAWARDRLQWLYASERRFVMVVLTASVLLKIPLILQVGGGEAQTVWGRHHSDVNRYLDQAASVLEGNFDLEVKGHPARQGPVYPAFLASTFRVFGPHSYDVVRVLQLLVFALASAALYDMARRVWNRSVGNYVLMLSTVWFAGFYWCGEILTESLFNFLLVGSLYALLLSLQHPIFVPVAGLLMATASHTRVTMLPLIPFLCIWLCWAGWRQNSRRAILRVAALLVVFASVFLPVKSAFSNGQVEDQWIGDELMGQIYMGVTFEPAPPAPKEMSRLQREWYLGGQLWHRASIDLLIHYLFYQVLGFWYPLFNANNGEYYIFDSTFFFAVPFFLFGLWRAPKNPGYWLIAAVFTGAYVLVLLFVYGTPRHRMPADPALILLGGSGLHHFVKCYFSLPSARYLLAALAAASAAMVPLSDSIFQGIRFVYSSAAS